jgi:hypothetical protein
MKSVALWCCALATAASLLVATHYRSRDPDSALYARLSSELARQPASRWIAPEWGGAWDHQGLFREHPVGILLPSVLLIRTGFPAEQAAYAVNMMYQLAVILLIPMVAAFVIERIEARSLAWLLQLLPVAFAYRIRGNQEHPLLMCFLAMLYATHRARTQPAWLALVVASFCFLVLIKGAFAMFALVAAALWLLVIPAPAGGSNRWAWAGLAATALAALLMMSAYEAAYVRTTGESFLDYYNSTRLGASLRLDDPRLFSHAIANVGFYLARLAWFAAPWSLLAFATILVWIRSKASRGKTPVFEATSDRALLWTLLVTTVFVLVLSPALVRAERFIFPTYFIVGAVGIVTAIRKFEGMRRFVAVTDRWPWLPVAVWMITFLLSLGSRLPRLLQG